MSELKPKFKVNEVARAEWEGKSIKAKIIEVIIFEKLNFVGYKLDTDQFFREEELSTDIRVGDIIKSEFNGVISLATKTGTENANVVEVECANNGSFRLCTSSEIEHLSEGEMQSMLDPLSFSTKKWIPKVHERVVTDKMLWIYDKIEDSYSAHQYTVISTVIEVREKENIVILDDYSSVKINDLNSLSKYKGN